MAESVFGSLVGTPNVEAAVIAAYRAWLPTYLAEVERQNELPVRSIPRPPTPESIHGGLDFEAYAQDKLPTLIIIVNPTGRPERSPSTGYAQAYEVQVGTVWIGDGNAVFAEGPEEEARLVAGYYGIANQLLVQQADLGGLAENVEMTAAPEVEMPDPEKRRRALSVVKFNVFVPQIVQDFTAPIGATPQEAWLYGGEPEAPFSEEPIVSQTNLNITAEDV